jgi:hypothetical protein
MVYSAGDIIRLTIKGQYLGQEVNNVFFFEIDSITAPDISLFDMLDDYAAEFEANVLNTLSNQLTYSLWQIDNLTDGLSFDELSQNEVGIQPGEPLASFYALGIKLARSTKITRNGSKRFPGMVENLVNGNVHSIPPGDITQMQTFLGLPLTFLDYNGLGDDITISPVIVGRTLNMSGVYELDLSKINQVNSALVNTFVTTQNSRKA